MWEFHTKRDKLRPEGTVALPSPHLTKLSAEILLREKDIIIPIPYSRDLACSYCLWGEKEAMK